MHGSFPAMARMRGSRCHAGRGRGPRSGGSSSGSPNSLMQLTDNGGVADGPHTVAARGSRTGRARPRATPHGAGHPASGADGKVAGSAPAGHDANPDEPG